MARILGLGGGIFLVRIDKVKSKVPPRIFLPLSALLSSLLLLSSALLLLLASILSLLVC